MANEELATIGRETIKIVKQGYYILNHKKVDLICSCSRVRKTFSDELYK